MAAIRSTGSPQALDGWRPPRGPGLLARGRRASCCIAWSAAADAQRAAFLLHHEDGASVEDLAQRLALPFETAKSRLRYALKKLRGCMGAYLDVLEPAR
jgi:hypothetical protein